ncbi:MAG: hypothetical protein QOJ20_1416 [Mycobacterium sp.]|jgi:hypothetical protein|nr:hypothetical protein [Mycobacterium sp.]
MDINQLGTVTTRSRTHPRIPGHRHHVDTLRAPNRVRNVAEMGSVVASVRAAHSLIWLLHHSLQLGPLVYSQLHEAYSRGPVEL